MKYDLLIVGGGPAGMMASIQAAKKGLSVLILEKNKSLGLKLLASGGTRCNITNKQFDTKGMVKMYGQNGRFLFSAFNAFSTDDLIEFFESRGLKLKRENNGRIFPMSNKSKDVLKVLLDEIKKYKNIKILKESPVKKIVQKDFVIERVELSNGTLFEAKKFLLTTGGKSYPETGSSGDAYKWIEKIGHKLIEPKPALCPIIFKENYVKDLEGLSINDSHILLFKDNKKISSSYGDFIFTSNGISGPAAMNLSTKISKNLLSKLFIKIDLKNEQSEKELDLEIQHLLNRWGGKMLKNVLNIILPARIVSFLLKKNKIPESIKASEIKKGERKKIVQDIKALTFMISSLAGFEKAIVTSGGVDLSGIDPKTMQSKIVKNLFFAGEIIDIDGPSGGYNLQVAWSTGYLSGKSA